MTNLLLKLRNKWYKIIKFKLRRKYQIYICQNQNIARQYNVKNNLAKKYKSECAIQKARDSVLTKGTKVGQLAKGLLGK